MKITLIALCIRLRLKCDGTCAETRFRLSAKRTSPFKSTRASVQSTTSSRGVRISGSNARSIMFRGSVKSTGYPLHSAVSPSLPLPCAITFQLYSPLEWSVGRYQLHDGRNPGRCAHVYFERVKVVCFVKYCHIFTWWYGTKFNITTPLHRVGAVGWGTALQTGRSRVRFPMVTLEFFIDIILPAALWPWGWLSL